MKKQSCRRLSPGGVSAVVVVEANLNKTQYIQEHRYLSVHPKISSIFALYAHSLISMNKFKLAAGTIEPINNQGSMFIFCLWTGWLSAKYYNLIV